MRRHITFIWNFSSIYILLLTDTVYNGPIFPNDILQKNIAFKKKPFSMKKVNVILYNLQLI